jgi:hypothetical protein
LNAKLADGVKTAADEPLSEFVFPAAYVPITLKRKF